MNIIRRESPTSSEKNARVGIEKKFFRVGSFKAVNLETETLYPGSFPRPKRNIHVKTVTKRV